MYTLTGCLCKEWFPLEFKMQLFGGSATQQEFGQMQFLHQSLWTKKRPEMISDFFSSQNTPTTYQAPSTAYPLRVAGCWSLSVRIKRWKTNLSLPDERTDVFVLQLNTNIYHCHSFNNVFAALFFNTRFECSFFDKLKKHAGFFVSCI